MALPSWLWSSRWGLDGVVKTIHVERTFDYELVRSIFTAPEVHKHLGDDFSPSRETYEPVKHPSLVYLLASNGDPLGIFLFAPENGICFNTHSKFLRVPGRLCIDFHNLHFGEPSALHAGAAQDNQVLLINGQHTMKKAPRL